MVKSVLGVNHQGLTDWKIQRLTAIYMALYTVFFFAYLIMHSGLSYADWHALFACQGLKVATILMLLAVLYHAWIGMWTVYTDYIKCTTVRAIVDTLTLLLFAACFIWGVLILWSV